MSSTACTTSIRKRSPPPARLADVDHHRDEVDLFQRVERRIDHADVEAMQRLMDTGRVDENHLSLDRWPDGLMRPDGLE